MTQPTGEQGMMVSEETGCEEVVYMVQRRRFRSYPVTEAELSSLLWMPWFARRRLIKRIRAETTFDEPSGPDDSAILSEWEG